MKEKKVCDLSKSFCCFHNIHKAPFSNVASTSEVQKVYMWIFFYISFSLFCDISSVRVHLLQAATSIIVGYKAIKET